MAVDDAGYTLHRLAFGIASLEPATGDDNEAATWAQHARDLAQCARVHDVVAGEGADDRVEAGRGEGEGLGAGAADAEGDAQPVSFASGLAHHLWGEVNTPRNEACSQEVELQVAGAHADFEHVGTEEMGYGSALPGPPLPQEERAADPIIGPCERAIELLEGEGEEAGTQVVVCTCRGRLVFWHRCIIQCWQERTTWPPNHLDSHSKAWGTSTIYIEY